MKKNIPLFYILAALSLLPLMITAESLWIDEAYTAQFAKCSSFSDFISKLLCDNYSEGQMPLGMFYAWFCGRFLGSTEWLMRITNILWGVITIGSCYRIGKLCKMSWLPIFMAVQPFLWYYMNEARPYGMQIASGSLLFMAILEADADPYSLRRWLPSFALGSLILCSSSLLGTIPFLFYLLVMLVVLFQKQYRVSGFALTVFLIEFFILVALAIFYLWTLTRGAGGAKIWKPGLENAIFSFYDFLGFGGVGPPRGDIRVIAKSSVGIFHAFGGYIPGLIILSGCYIATALLFLKEKCFLSRSVMFSGFVLVGTFTMLLAASFIMRWPFWGRHLAAIFPLIVFIIAYPFRSGINEMLLFKRVLLTFIILLLLSSSLRLRFSPIYRKDDYRSAAACAKAILASGGRVWWAADPTGAEYYGLSIGKPKKGGAIDPQVAVNIIGIPEIEMEAIHPPTTVILSKEDIYDPRGSLLSWIKEHHYVIAQQFPSFKVYVAP